MASSNCYADDIRAAAYAKLEFNGTYYLAYRDLPKLILDHASGNQALDFGCGTGRSTRFLRKLDFEVVAIDSAADMLTEARRIDPAGDYRLIENGDFSSLQSGSFDLILSAFTFDNVPLLDQKLQIFRSLRELLNATGILVNLVSSPEIYLHEWASFSTKDFPENLQAQDGDYVQIINTDTEDRRPVTDVVCSDKAYRQIYTETGFQVLVMHETLAKAEEPYPWVNETQIAPWVIYVLK